MSTAADRPVPTASGVWASLPKGMTLKPFRSGPFYIPTIEIPTIEPGESNSIIVGGDVPGARVHVRYKILGAEGCRRKVHFIGALPGAPLPG